MQGSAHSHVYLSPHLDDAVFSCGGTIYSQARRGEDVLVATVFAGSPPDHDLTPFTRELWERWGGADDPAAARRAEDRAALDALGAGALHLPYLDCVYRQHPATGEALYPTVEDIFAEIHPAEAALVDALYDDLRDRLGPDRPLRLCAPLGAGHHVDHQIVRRVAMLFLADGAEVALYEDWPYAGDAETVARALDEGARCWRRERTPFVRQRTPFVRERTPFVHRVSPLSEEALAAKIDAAARYVSQISTFWPNIEAMDRAVREQALRTGGTGPGEGFWAPVRPPGRPTTVNRP